MTLTTATGREITLPLFDPLVAAHLDASSYIDTLLHEINVSQIYARLFKDKTDLTFLDLGANIGLVSLYAVDNCKRIVAVEPAPATYTVLQAMTRAEPKIETVRAALAPFDHECQFFQNDLNTTASSTVNTYGTPTTVPGLTLSSILSIYQLEQVDICKVDVEGAEGEALSFEQLEKAKPIVRSWYVETHNCPASTWEDKMGRLVRDLCRLGYHQMEVKGMTIWAK